MLLTRPRIIILTPIKNEAWILKRFLECASMWADDIIIADQSSDDGSRELAESFPKVTVIDNPSHSFSEVERQRLLIDAARRLPTPRLLMALDADEIMSANILNAPEWEAAIRMPPGTVLEFAKVEMDVVPERYYMHSAADRQAWLPFGYIDDGRAHDGDVIHTCRIPRRPDSPGYRLRDIALLHVGRWNAPRLRSKDRWYRCFEHIAYPEKSIVEIQRAYDWYERLRDAFDVRPSPPGWLLPYSDAGIDLRDHEAQTNPVFWWDWDILRMFAQHGVEPFRHLDIWSFDWESLRLAGMAQGRPDVPKERIVVPRSCRARWIRAILKASGHYRTRRYIDRVLRRCDRFIR